MQKSKNYFFSGCYANFPELITDYSDESILINHVTNQLNESINLINSTLPIMVESRMWGSTILPTICALQISKHNILTVLDYGGGGGKQYVEIKSSLGNDFKNRFNYHLVETPNFVKFSENHLKNIFHSDANNFFVHSEIPALKVDIVSCTSSLQYAPDWRSELIKLINCKPNIVALINTPINSHLTYARIQHNLKVPIAQWVLGASDVDTIMHEHGYQRAFFSNHELNYPTQDTPNNTATFFSTVIYIKK